MKPEQLYVNKVKESGKDSKVENTISINWACWTGFNDFIDQFAFVDDVAKVTLFNYKTRTTNEVEGVSSSSLNTCAIEQKFSKLLACGGLEPKIAMFTINKVTEGGKIQKFKELSGHHGIITCLAFLDDNYLISCFIYY